MFGNLSGYWLQFVPLTVMVMVILARHALMERRRASMTCRDAALLRTALGAELSALLGVYEDNLRLVSERAGYVLSCKCQAAVYRANLTRLVILHHDEVAALIAAQASRERLESIFAAHCKGSSNLAWRTPPEKAALEELRQALEVADAAAREAAARLNATTAANPSDTVPGQSPMPAACGEHFTYHGSLGARSAIPTQP